MPKSYRIRTTPGVNQSLQVTIDQEFDFLEILSLKILQSDIYTRQCSDYGVVVGRISINNGFGIPNAKVSVFIPLTDEDSENPVISELYPYKTTSDVNDEGYRYNLLPYLPQYNGHAATGTFPDKSDVLIDPNLIEVYDKYYKYTTTTNDSGDYMIFGVPVGPQTLFVDIDLSDIGEFSLTPNDLIRMGIATEGQVNKTTFKTSADLNSLPQIKSFNRNIEVTPFWGQPDICTLGITRTDFDLSKEFNIKIQPTSVFMGSIISSPDEQFIKTNGKVNKKMGELCSLIAGPGEIRSIRQTINFDEKGRPALEKFELHNGGQVIDDNGSWMVDLPMNLDYITTDEYGNRTISDNPLVGIPTKGKYRFKVKWNQSPTLGESIKRGYFLVPNIREYGWSATGSGPSLTNRNSPSFKDFISSYAFSINWDDYGYTGDTSTSPYYATGSQHIQDAIDCEDKFYEFNYNKVYTISELITQYRSGGQNRRFIAIKDILNEECESENNKFPSNDGMLKTNFIFVVFRILMFLMFPVLFLVMILLHIVSFIVLYLLQPLLLLLSGFMGYFVYQEFSSGVAALISVPPNVALATIFILKGTGYLLATAGLVTLTFAVQKIKKYFKNFKIPNYTYPNCDLCECSDSDDQDTSSAGGSATNFGGSTTNDVPTNNKGTALLSQFTYPMLFSPYSDAKWSGPTAGLMSGQPIPQTGEIGYGVGTSVSGVKKSLSTKACEDDCPGVSTQLNEFIEMVYDEDDEENKIIYWGVLSTDLPLPERINLFNLKSKYYSNTIPNANFNGGADGGQGVNQIKVRFATDLNPSPSTFHMDNVVVIFVQPSVGELMETGKLITFQDLKMSSDVNLTGGTLNDYGLNSITGTSLLFSATPTPVNVEWARPNGIGNNTTTYLMTGDTQITNYIKYPTDVEYFQVVTSMKYSDYKSQVSNTLTNSLYSRHLNNELYAIRLSKQNPKFKTAGYKLDCNTSYITVYPSLIEQFSEYADQYVVFLVRGVDPHSSRIKCEYDLSKLFGYSTFGNKVYSGLYKPNIPIQGGIKNVKHVGDNQTVDSYSGVRLFHKSFQFLPSNMSGFTTTITRYYSGLDSTQVLSDYSKLNQNQYITRWVKKKDSGSDTHYVPLDANNYGPSLPNKPTYYAGEHIEGGSYLTMRLSNNAKFYKTGSCGCGSKGVTCVDSRYFCPKIDNDFNIIGTTSQNNNYIVMRSDRLPLSTFDYQPKPGINSYRPLHANPGFEVYILDDEGGASPTQGYSSGIPSNGDGDSGNEIIDSLQCGNLVPLSCYKYIINDNGDKELTIDKYGSDCWVSVNSKIIMENGCYVMVTVPFLSIAKDSEILLEWRLRMLLNFGACQNIFSHMFTNNWINGTLFAFPFANTRKFDNSNNPYYEYETDVVVLDNNTFNYYYRVSPFSSDNKFVGLKTGVGGGNQYSLNFPTTIMDLGPRDTFTQEVTLTDDYDGYIVNKLKPTTFNDITDLLNIFILNRLTSEGLLSNIKNANISTYFSRKNQFIDGDYAQMNAINSEFGVIPFDGDVYGTDDIFVNNGKNNNMGIYFSSYTENRDFITPKRNMLSTNGLVTNNSCYSYLPENSQVVPFYQWEIVQPDNQSIFGGDENEWYTKPINSGGFFSYKYQRMDRWLSSSRYFRTNSSQYTKYFKGYIYSVDSNGENDPGITTWDRNSLVDNVITTGAPYYFYFGLKRGKTAFDLFSQKWLDLEVID
jgi:hypothetical protein